MHLKIKKHLSIHLAPLIFAKMEGDYETTETASSGINSYFVDFLFRTYFKVNPYSFLVLWSGPWSHKRVG